MENKTTTCELLEIIGDESLGEAVAQHFGREDITQQQWREYFWWLRDRNLQLVLDINAGNTALEHWLENVIKMTKLVYGQLAAIDNWWEFQFMKINTKGGNIQLMEPYETQIKLMDRVKKVEEENSPVRIILLKPRQFGGSTWIEEYIYLRSKRNINTRALIVADKKATSLNLYNMYQTFYMHDAFRRKGRLLGNMLLYDYVGEDNTLGLIKPKDLMDLDAGVDDELIDVVNGGYVKVDSGYSGKGGGRSHTFQYVHASEVAFYEKPEQTFLAMKETVPFLPDTAIFVESTANGVGNYFYDLWNNAGDEFERVFISWKECGYEYALKCSDDEMKAIQDTLDDDELRLYGDGVSIEQIKWRRMKIKSYNGDVDKFNQEYPETPQHAFVTTGRPVFAPGSIEELKKLAETEKTKLEDEDFVVFPEDNTAQEIEEIKKEIYISRRTMNYNATKGRFESDKRGVYWQWLAPRKRGEYILGVDVAEGIENAKDDPDYSVIQVMDRGHEGELGLVYRQCAEYRDRITVDDLAVLVETLAAKYNHAWINIEANNHGLAVITQLSKTYARIMRRPDSDMLEKTTTGGKILSRKITRRPDGATKRLGWLTTTRTRPLMIDELVKKIYRGELIVYSSRLIAEMETFVYDGLGKPAAQPGKHDDCVMAMALAVIGNELMPSQSESEKMLADSLKDYDVGKDIEELMELREGEHWKGYTIV